MGIVCAAPVLDSWYRAQLINYYPEENEADLRFLDYGGYARIDASCLRQIRSDFLSLPFQAVECYLSNVVPLQGKMFIYCGPGSVQGISSMLLTVSAKCRDEIKVN